MNPVWLWKARNEIARLLQFLKTSNSRELHLRAWEVAIRLDIPEPYVWQAIAEVAAAGTKLTTWSQSLWREITYQEWATPDFFHNRDDSGYVRLRPAEA